MSGKVIPGLTNPYPTTKPVASSSKKKRRGGKKNKKAKETKENNGENKPKQSDTQNNSKADSVANCESLHTAAPEFLNTEDLISQMRSQLEKARELKDHQTANVIRQRIWLLQDAAAGVTSKISDEELEAILSETNKLNLELATK